MSKNYNTNNSLYNRLDNRLDNRLHNCTICNESFKFTRGLVIHNATHSNPLECKYCGKQFSKICTYQHKIHENKHKGIKINYKRKFEKDSEMDSEMNFTFDIETYTKNHKKVKLDKTLFTPQIVQTFSDIKLPVLLQGFKPISETESEYETDSEYIEKDISSNLENLKLLANVSLEYN